MLNTRRGLALLLLVSITPIWLGATCTGTDPDPTPTPPQPTQPTTLVNETQSSPYGVTFIPDMGRVVTVSVTGSLTASRPEIGVGILGMAAPGVSTLINKTVANGQVTGNITTGTFTPTSSTVHILQGQDDAAAGGDFSISVTQAAP